MKNPIADFFLYRFRPLGSSEMFLVLALSPYCFRSRTIKITAIRLPLEIIISSLLGINLWQR